LKNVLTRFKKQKADTLEKSKKYTEYMIQVRDEIIKHVFKNKGDSVVNCPVAFAYIISNIQGTDGASVDDIMRLAEERGMPISKVTEDLERLKRDGRIYERFEGRYRLA
jgi:DNA replicative helicase MCM subunit Mcm2 (Cdc46/Mcm family)